jgi:hypothetical protein
MLHALYAVGELENMTRADPNLVNVLQPTICRLRSSFVCARLAERVSGGLNPPIKEGHISLDSVLGAVGDLEGIIRANARVPGPLLQQIVHQLRASIGYARLIPF